MLCICTPTCRVTVVYFILPFFWKGRFAICRHCFVYKVLDDDTLVADIDGIK